MASPALVTHLVAVALGVIAGVLLTKRVDATDLETAHQEGYNIAINAAKIRAKARATKAAATRRQRKADP
jgi:hypothetical protein